MEKKLHELLAKNGHDCMKPAIEPGELNWCGQQRCGQESSPPQQHKFTWGESRNPLSSQPPIFSELIECVNSTINQNDRDSDDESVNKSQSNGGHICGGLYWNTGNRIRFMWCGRENGPCRKVEEKQKKEQAQKEREREQAEWKFRIGNAIHTIHSNFPLLVTAEQETVLLKTLELRSDHQYEMTKDHWKCRCLTMVKQSYLLWCGHEMDQCLVFQFDNQGDEKMNELIMNGHCCIQRTKPGRLFGGFGLLDPLDSLIWCQREKDGCSGPPQWVTDGDRHQEMLERFRQLSQRNHKCLKLRYAFVQSVDWCGLPICDEQSRGRSTDFHSEFPEDVELQ